jgi:hypothetical protein
VIPLFTNVIIKMKSNKRDYLKFWKVIREYFKVRHNLSQADLDMLLYLYSERYFNITTFREYEKIFMWDKKRFYRLIQEGWIELFASKQKGRPAMRSKALYCLSFKAKRMVNSIYKKLEGEEIPETMCNNPMFKKNVRFSDKVYRNMIITMNEELKQNKLTGQELRHVPE